ncbi:hypothetical protein POVWA2_005930 [Plasmodium ovale wallikeri]|uniref:Secreted protein n=1 Tax=Plasmodium ovale wallikeri TaxID=864142 RepID=A0A1A8YHZ9_PLAOA|nr:hypothetical protein POVWA1_005850 [Plasmodium ovale wallikeri]SBT31769.1 hypothetical protein POVWA2_005930 [Plasmodium ovale wallikeri]
MNCLGVLLSFFFFHFSSSVTAKWREQTEEQNGEAKTRKKSTSISSLLKYENGEHDNDAERKSERATK